MWPGTHSSLTLLKTDNLFSADFVVTQVNQNHNGPPNGSTRLKHEFLQAKPFPLSNHQRQLIESVIWNFWHLLLTFSKLLM